MSETDGRTLGQRDAAHHLHPFTDNRELAAAGGATVIERGEGCYLWDDQGHRYLDALAGLWCVNVGYGRRELADVAAEQMQRLAYYNTFFNTTTGPTAELAETLAELMPGHLNTALFANSGSEVCDSAIRLARYYWQQKGKPQKRIVIGREEGYHGSTLAALSAGGIGAMHAQGGTGLPDFAHIEAPYRFLLGHDMPEAAFAAQAARALESKIEELGAENVALFICEPIQGAGGLIFPPEGYLAEVQNICQRHDVLFVLDEVISAFGRLGAWSAAELFGLSPDFMTLAKGLSSGYQPISALMVSDPIAEVLRDAEGGLAHGFTYSGHPVAAAVALENLAILKREKLVERVREEIGPYFCETLKRLETRPLVGEVRGLGLLGAVELIQDKAAHRLFDPPGVVAAVCRENLKARGIIVRAVRDTLLIAPPFVVTREQVDDIVDTLEAALEDISRELGIIAEEQKLAEAVHEADRPLAGRVALVTGASRGIGAEVARTYARAGATVVAAARDEAALRARCAEIAADGGSAIPVAVDFSTRDGKAETALMAALEKLGSRLDILVLNAAQLGDLKPLPELEDAAWDRVIAVNLTAPLRLLHLLHPFLSLSDAGRCVFVTSGAARGAHADWSAYAASKAGLEAMMRAYAAENRKFGLRINAVDPGAMQTGMRAAAFPGEDPGSVTPVEAAGPVFLRLAVPDCSFSGAVVPVVSSAEAAE
ncbi:aminotransferase [Nisaea acidiphila]|uniref:Aminotransferase n=1 Tax=Nisaea acidiphila TaxID=1862145 RepID=A0A9J7AYB5_9PROT|nr:aminotransferase [Nisaea acidiphila]UUX51417.1 aminotransferase [Nisaea acidiphila]